MKTFLRRLEELPLYYSYPETLTTWRSLQLMVRLSLNQDLFSFLFFSVVLTSFCRIYSEIGTTSTLICNLVV